MTELNENQYFQNKEIYNYLMIYSFRNNLTNLAFEDIIENKFKGYCIHDSFANIPSYYFSIPINRENLINKIKYIISQIKTDIEKLDYLYIISNITDSNDYDEERDILIGHDVIHERDKLWSEIVHFFQKDLSKLKI